MMIYKAPYLILLPLAFAFQTTLLAETVSHSHNGRVHTHPLPTTGLNHSHTPKPTNAQNKKVKKKLPKTTRSHVVNKPANNKKTQAKRPKVVVRRTPRTEPLPVTSGAPTDCQVQVTLSSDKNFTSITSDRGGNTPYSDTYSVQIKRLFILSAKTGRPYITQNLNLSPKYLADVTDHRTGEKYKSATYNFTNVLEGHAYIATLGAGWITEPRSVRFRCPNARGERKFSLPRIKHIGIMGDG